MSDGLKIMFMHPNMPGQYKHLCRIFADDPKNQVVFVTKNKTVEIQNVRKVQYTPPREPSAHTHRYLLNAERAVLQGQEVWRNLRQLKEETGFVPDVICSHPGWGDALFVKDLYPDTPLLSYFEFYYVALGADVGFDPEDPVKCDDVARVRVKNTVNLLNLDAMDWGISPTHWQKSLHPNDFHPRISVLHDGIDTSIAKPSDNPDLSVSINKSLTLTKKDKVVTYIARNFEPYRGFPTFMQAAKKILDEDPDVHIIAIGADDVSYGKRPPAGTTYRKIWMDRTGIDRSRLHFVGTVSYGDLIKLMQISSAHIYLTYPFVLSWSALESMACGCYVVMSDTQPVKEVIRDGENGVLVDFFNPDDVVEKVLYALNNQEETMPIRKNARDYVIQRYDLQKLLPLHTSLITDLAAKNFPPPTHERIMDLYKD